MAKVRAKAAEEEEVIVEEVGTDVSAEDFLSQNQNLILVIVLLIVVVAGALIYFFSNQGSQNAEANEAMFQAIYYYEQDSLNLALNGDGNNYGFLDVIDEYGSTDASDIAKYYAGVISVRQGLTAEGIDYLQSVSTGDNMLGMSTAMALGFAYEEQGDYEKAAASFEDAASIPAENDQTTPTMLFNAGRNYEAAGNISKARALYQQIKDKYPTSTEGFRIDKYLGRVSE